ncbi:MAG: DUF4416 family protein [Candidatus Omnitrophota bacterium]
MGVPSGQKPVKLVVSIIFREEKFLGYAMERLKRRYGALEPLERTMPFDFTDYYAGEFGKPLRRKLICFTKLVSKENICRIKLETNRIENRYSFEGKRTVNLDPGYVTEAKLILLTTKDYTHRVYAGKGIFAESTLFFQGGTFNPWQWTYPDYASGDMISYFNQVRDIYMADVKRLKNKGRPAIAAGPGSSCSDRKNTL